MKELKKHGDVVKMGNQYFIYVKCNGCGELQLKNGASGYKYGIMCDSCMKD